MGTTLTAAYVDDAHVAIAHVGDSRAYLFRDGTLQRLTQDHSLVDELVRRGKLTEEQAAEHPQRSIITRALGPEPDVEVDTWTYPGAPRRRDPALLGRAHLDDLRGAGQGDPRLARQPRRGGRCADQTRPTRRAAGTTSPWSCSGSRRRTARTPLGRGDDGGHRGPAPTAADGDSDGAAESVSAAADESRGADGGSRGPATHSTQNQEDTGRAAARHEAAHPAPAGSAQARAALRQAARGASGHGDRARADRRRRLPGHAASCTSSAPTPRAWSRSTGACPTTSRSGCPCTRPTTCRAFPASVVPAPRRAQLLNNNLRSQSDATSLVMDLEQGRISP